MPNYYDDQKRLIATSDAELLTFFKSFGDGTRVQNLPFVLPCPMYGLYKVDSNAVLPKFISKDGIEPSKRIYPQLLPSDLTGINVLCNGVTFTNIVPVPVIGIIESDVINYYVEVDGTTVYTLHSGESYEYV